MPRPSLTILIPCYNESHRLPGSLADLKNWASLASMPINFLFVDDGSTDSTSELIHASGLNAKVLTLNSNQGKGAAVAAGVQVVETDLVLIMDADLSTSLDSIDRFYRSFLDSPCDLLVASRFHPASRVLRSWPRFLSSYLFFFCVHSLIPFSTFDTQCGFKLFKTKVAADLFRDLTFNHYSFDFEVLLRAERKYMVRELPVTWTEREGSKLNLLKDGVRMFKDLLELRKRK